MVTFAISDKTFVIFNIKNSTYVSAVFICKIMGDQYFYLTSDSVRLNTKVLPSDSVALN